MQAFVGCLRCLFVVLCYSDRRSRIARSALTQAAATDRPHGTFPDGHLLEQLIPPLLEQTDGQENLIVLRYTALNGSPLSSITHCHLSHPPLGSLAHTSERGENQVPRPRRCPCISVRAVEINRNGLGSSALSQSKGGPTTFGSAETHGHCIGDFNSLISGIPLRNFRSVLDTASATYSPGSVRSSPPHRHSSSRHRWHLDPPRFPTEAL
jgi:hypothetical protein